MNIHKKRSILKHIDTISEFKMESPVFSVVIPVYNRTDELQDAIESVLGQSFQNFEIILVCDGSPAETMSVVRSFEGNEHVHIFSYPDNSGNACRGRNKGIAMARGEYIALLDSDDLCFPDRLRNTLYYFLAHDADMVYGSVRLIVDGTRKVMNLAHHQILDARPMDIDDGLSRAASVNPVFTCTASVKKSCLQKYGAFRQEMRYREDHELWLRLAYHRCRIIAAPDLFSYYRIHGNNAELLFIDKDEFWKNEMLRLYKEPYDKHERTR